MLLGASSRTVSWAVRAEPRRPEIIDSIPGRPKHLNTEVTEAPRPRSVQGIDGNGRHTRRPPNVTQSPTHVTMSESLTGSPDLFSTAAQDFDSGSLSRKDQEEESPTVRT